GPRRRDARRARALSGVRIRPPQGLLDPRAFRAARAPWAVPHSPARLRPDPLLLPEGPLRRGLSRPRPDEPAPPPQPPRPARLASERAERRRERRAVAEGPHLVGAALSHGWPLEALVVSESGLARPEIAALVAAAGLEPTVLADRVFRSTFEVATPQGIAAEL